MDKVEEEREEGLWKIKAFSQTSLFDGGKMKSFTDGQLEDLEALCKADAGCSA